MIAELAEDPRQGTALGQDCYKVRMAIRSNGRGRSGGARVITCVKVVKSTVILLTVYDKSETDTISDKELGKLLALIGRASGPATARLWHVFLPRSSRAISWGTGISMYSFTLLPQVSVSARSRSAVKA